MLYKQRKSKTMQMPNNTRTSYTVRNIRFALIGQAAALLVSFIARRVFLQVLGGEYLGINGLFDNILKLLSLAELGVGAAITFSLYQPLAANNREQIAVLMGLYRKTYAIIGTAVCIIGFALTPFLSSLVKDMPSIPSIRLIYLLFVANSALSYFFAYKRSLLIADQKRYLATLYRYGCFCVLSVLQIALLLVTRNYLLYLLLQLFFTLAENLLISRKANVLYPYIRKPSFKKLDAKTYSVIKHNVFAMVFHKIGGVVVAGTDSVLLSRLVGLLAVGVYSNYYLVTNALNTIYNLLYQSVTASIGNLGVEADEDKLTDVFWKMDFFTAWLQGFTFVCLINLFNPFISLWVGKEYLFPFPVVLAISVSFYLTGMRKSVLTFRDALGLYWHDRYKPVFESIINLGVSIWLGIELGAVGVFIGTIISTLVTCFWVEPYVLFHYGLHRSVWLYFKRYLLYLAVTGFAAAVTYACCCFVPSDGVLYFLLRTGICICVPNGIYLLVFYKTKAFRYFVSLIKRKVFSIPS